MPIILLCCAAMLLLSGSSYAVSSSDISGFDADEAVLYGEESAAQVVELLNMRMLSRQPEQTGKIESFAVNDDGRIAVAYENALLCVYANDYTYQYGIRFDMMGIYGVDWINGKLTFVDSRSAFALLINDDGTPDSVYWLTSKPFSQYFDDVIQAGTHSMNDCEYSLTYTSSKNCGESLETQNLVKTDANGTQTVLYSHTYKPDNVLLMLAALILGIPLVIVHNNSPKTHR